MDFQSAQEVKKTLHSCQHLAESLLSYLSLLAQSSWQIFSQSIQDLWQKIELSGTIIFLLESLAKFQESQLSGVVFSNHTVSVSAIGIGAVHVTTELTDQFSGLRTVT